MGVPPEVSASPASASAASAAGEGEDVASGPGAGLVVAGLDLLTQLLLVVLGLALVFSPDALTQGVDVGIAPTWDELAFALPLALLAYTGLETALGKAQSQGAWLSSQLANLPQWSNS